MSEKIKEVAREILRHCQKCPHFAHHIVPMREGSLEVFCCHHPGRVASFGIMTPLWSFDGILAFYEKRPDGEELDSFVAPWLDFPCPLQKGEKGENEGGSAPPRAEAKDHE